MIVGLAPLTLVYHTTRPRYIQPPCRAHEIIFDMSDIVAWRVEEEAEESGEGLVTEGVQRNSEL